MIKYTVNLLLNLHKTNVRGLHPIYLKITIARKTAYIATGHFLQQKHWDAKNEQVKEGHLMAGTINSDIATRKQTVIKAIVAHQVAGKAITAAQVKAQVSGNTDQHNLFDFAESFIKEVQHKRASGTLENYRKHLKVIELYNGSRSLAFEAIDHTWLVNFEHHLRAKVGGNYIHNIWKTLKTYFNAAKKRGVISVYPFATYENPEYKAPVKDYLSLEELDKIEELADTTTDPVVKQTAVYFLLGCYSGLRLSDWLQFDYDKHVRDGWLYLRTKKTGEDVSLPITGRLEKHMHRVRGLKLQITEQEINRTLKGIAGIRKKISSHTARHSFAKTMCAELGISAETCAEVMAITLQTCVENYYRVTGRKIEKECRAAWEK